MTWLLKLYHYIMGSLCILLAILSFIILLPFILICLICMLTPPPFTMLINIIFPIFYFMGPNGARTCLDKLLDGLRYLINRAAQFCRDATLNEN